MKPIRPKPAPENAGPPLVPPPVLLLPFLLLPFLLLPFLLLLASCGGTGQPPAPPPGRMEAPVALVAGSVAAPPFFRPADHAEVEVRCDVDVGGVPSHCRGGAATDPRIAPVAAAFVAAASFRPALLVGRPVAVKDYPLPVGLDATPDGMLSGVSRIPPERVSLHYPPNLFRHGIEGEVVLDCTITALGLAQPCRIVHSTDPRFNMSALRFASQVRFRPAVRNRIRVEVPHHVIHIRYKLDDRPGPAAGP
ncbi:energy transducer TonB [Rhizosaccharibacter radicis]|uniref:Energy transducer TonB n=1 Tax=Rhizosaccharibacter radicis TaxID=2782605 RepID=A0ABT1W1N7_9PROT|nr:energy transducer TonB [Acetobacteraceae bacterium KSS12]